MAENTKTNIDLVVKILAALAICLILYDVRDLRSRFEDMNVIFASMRARLDNLPPPKHRDEHAEIEARLKSLEYHRGNNR